MLLSTVVFKIVFGTGYTMIHLKFRGRIKQVRKEVERQERISCEFIKQHQ